jgi:hypothetical protein
MVNNLVANIQNQVEASKVSLLDAYQAVSQSCRQTGSQLSQNSQLIVDKIQRFVDENKEAIFFTGCCGAAAYFGPTLFFPVALITAVVRVEFSRNLKKLANDYLKDDKNPYKLNPYYDNCVSSLDLMMGTVGGVDAIALGTIFMTNSWAVNSLPILAGIAAGNCLAKLGMNASHFLVS